MFKKVVFNWLSPAACLAQAINTALAIGLTFGIFVLFFDQMLCCKHSAWVC